MTIWSYTVSYTHLGIVIGSKKGEPIKAAADGVVTTLDEDEELGICINQAIGNGYIATYGQVIDVYKRQQKDLFLM